MESNERIDLIPGTDLELIQDKNKFCYGIDAILLSSYARVKKDDLVIDLGTGTGIVALRIYDRYRPKKVYGIEIQEDMAEMARRSLELNKLEDNIEIINMDLKELSNRFERNSIDVIVSNPPYMKEGGALLNPNKSISIARHEIHCDIEDIIREAVVVLKEDRGRLYLIHRPNRLVDIFYLGRKYRLEPKRACFIHPRIGKPANLVLVELVKYGQEDLVLDDPIYVYDDKNQYTEDIYKIYDRSGKGYDKW